MTELRLIEGDRGPLQQPGGLFEADPPLPVRLPPGRHGIPSDLVALHQRHRLLNAMGEALREHGYARVTAEQVSKRAGVSIRTFYKHFGNLWDCLLAAHDAAADRLCERIEVACADSEAPSARLDAGVDATLALFADEPAMAILLGGQPPLEAPALAAARRHLVARLAAMLRRGRWPVQDRPAPAELDERLVDASLTYVCGRVSRGEAAQIRGLGPELACLLARVEPAGAAFGAR